jgi:hypothetical protein
MHDLLYLSETKMQALVPQLPKNILRRLGFEGKLNLGVASLGASMAAATASNSIEQLDAVVEMIERERGSLWRTDQKVRAGDWIQFEEEFHYSSAWPGLKGSQDHVSGLVYFAAVQDPYFVMCGSGAHVLDRRQLTNEEGMQGGRFYVEGIREYGRLILERSDEAAVGVVPTPPESSQHPLTLAVLVLAETPRYENAVEREAWSGPVWLSGHARVLANGRLDDTGPEWLLGTPLYIEYARA